MVYNNIIEEMDDSTVTSNSVHFTIKFIHLHDTGNEVQRLN